MKLPFYLASRQGLWSFSGMLAHPSLKPLLLLLTAAVMASGCGPSQEKAKPTQKAPTVSGEVRSQVMGAAHPGEKPWICHVQQADLDRDGKVDVLACDGKANAVVWLRNLGDGRFEEKALTDELPAPVHTEVVDFDGDGDMDVLVASMGVVFPNNDPIGAVYLLRCDGGVYRKEKLLDQIPRVTDVRAADFDGDKRLDLLVAQFGYDQGAVHWYRQESDGTFSPNLLIGLSGCVNAVACDFDHDGDMDVAAIMSQQWEEVVLFVNDGRGQFSTVVLWGSTNEDYGSSGMTLDDVNRDGKPDLVFTNGDGFDYAEPGSRPWHGVQWLENLGGLQFRYHRIGNWPGAYSPVVMDFDGDGRRDVLITSAFQDWARNPKASLVVFLQQSDGHFLPLELAKQPTHLVTAVAGDFFGDGRPAWVTGGFHAYPPYNSMSRLMLWERAAKP